MNATVTVGRRLIPVEHIALVEPFDPNTQLPLPTERSFHTRVVLLNRESLLSEEELPTFAEKYGFRLLTGDGIATNPVINSFSVEAFVPTPGFVPTKEYRSRLLWRDLDGERQSKLLLSTPETVLALAVRGETEQRSPSLQKAKPVRRARRKGIVPNPS